MSFHQDEFHQTDRQRLPSWKNPLRVKYLEIINKIEDFNTNIPEARNLSRKDLFYVISDMEALLSELQELYGS